MELSYILGNENSKQNYYISGNGTLLYFWKQISPPPPPLPKFYISEKQNFLIFKEELPNLRKTKFLIIL